jgi:biotin carboxyl carrier protein
MKYTAILNDKEREIEISPHESVNHCFTVNVDGKSHQVDARLCAPDLMSILIDNSSYDISFSHEDSSVLLNFRNRYYNIEVLDERRMRMRKVRSELEVSGPEIITTSMPGKVVKVMVEEGQEVEPQQGIIIIEAMKMENEIRCRNKGIIKSINVQPQQTVEGNATLVEIEPA